jgi:short-subunit dehydrogenase
MFMNKVIIITGASSGLGRALAIALAKQQASLILFSRNKHALQDTKFACEKFTSHVDIVVGDVTKIVDCNQLINVAKDKYNQIDCLINNAGLSMWSRFSDIEDIEVYDELMRTNYLGAVYCTHSALPLLRKSKGMIVVISSVQGFLPIPFHSGYVAAKHALQGFFSTLRLEETDLDILIVSPSWIRDTSLRKNAIGIRDTNSLARKHNDAMSLDFLVKKILAAMAAKKAELIVPYKIRLLKWLRKFSTKIADSIIKYKLQRANGKR